MWKSAVEGLRVCLPPTRPNACTDNSVLQCRPAKREYNGYKGESLHNIPNPYRRGNQATLMKFGCSVANAAEACGWCIQVERLPPLKWG